MFIRIDDPHQSWEWYNPILLGLRFRRFITAVFQHYVKKSGAHIPTKLILYATIYGDYCIHLRNFKQTSNRVASKMNKNKIKI